MVYVDDCKCVSSFCIRPLTCRAAVCYPPGTKITCLEALQNEVTTQKKIWFKQRVHSSEYIGNLSALTVTGNRNCGNTSNLPKKRFDYVNWNQGSDRAVPSIATLYLPRQKTSNRPGGTSSAGKGVDIKHNSYARYLARKKSKNLQTNTNMIDPPCPENTNYCHKKPLYGNKWFETGLIDNCNKIACCKSTLKCTEKNC